MPRLFFCGVGVGCGVVILLWILELLWWLRCRGYFEL